MSYHSDEMTGDGYTNLLANAGLYDEMEADFEEREMVRSEPPLVVLRVVIA